MPIFQPTDITGCFGWYRASSIGWGAVTGYVTYWPDDSGSGNYLNLVRAGSGTLRAPVYFTNIINGLPAVHFNGNNRIDSYINASSSRNWGLPTAPSSLTCFSVFAPQDVIRAQVVFGYNNDLQDIADKNSFIVGIGGSGASDFVTNNISGWFFGWGRDAGFGQWRYTASRSGIMHGVNQWVLRTDRFEPSTRSFNFDWNGATYATGIASTSFNVLNYFTFGTDDETSILQVPARYYTGYIAETILYNRRLNDEERENVEAYLRSKYALDGGGSTPLFMVGTESPTGLMYGNMPLTTYSSPNAESGMNLYTVNLTSFPSSIPLYIGSSQTSSSGWKLYIGASSTSDSGHPLYISGYETYGSSIPLFTLASTPYSTGRPLYIGGLDTYSSGLSLYTSSAALYSGSMTLFTSAGTQTQATTLYTYGNETNSGLIPLYIGSSTTFSSGIPLFMDGTYAYETKATPLYIGSSETYSTGFPLYTSAATPINSSTTLYLGPSTLYSGSKTLYIPGSLEASYFRLYMHGHDLRSGQLSLYIGAASTVGSGPGGYTAGLSVSSGSMNLFLKQTPPVSGVGSTRLFLSAPTTINTSGYYNTIPMYMYSIGAGASMPMYVENHENAPQEYSDMPLYLKTTELVNPVYDNITALVFNNVIITGRRVKMYIRGDGVMDGASIGSDRMNLFLKQRQGVSEIVNLYMRGSTTGSLSTALFTKGVYTYNSGTTLVISGCGSSGTVPFYVRAAESYSSGLSLYTYTTPSINDGKNLYTYGF